MNPFRRCLELLDVPGIRALWKKTAPQAPQPASDAEALAALHRARTEAESLPIRDRAYSHRWCEDHNVPSGLPDELKPKAERIHPRIVEGVALSVRTTDPDKAPLARAIQRAQEQAVLEAYEDGNTAPDFIKARLRCARREVLAQW